MANDTNNITPFSIIASFILGIAFWYLVIHFVIKYW